MSILATGLWKNLERFASPATVLAEWRMVLGDEFADAEPFLRVTQEQAEGYPCTRSPACECRHEVVFHSPQNIVAACRCEPSECQSIRLEPRDLLIYAMDMSRLCAAVARALKFDGASVNSGISHGAPNTWRVGTNSRTLSPVCLAVCQTEERLLANIEALINAQKEPFILLAPSQRHKSATVMSVLQRQGCVFLPLSQCLTFSGAGNFRVKNSIQPVLDRFAAGLAEGSGLAGTVEKIGRSLEAIANNQIQLQSSKARLEQMRGQGLFGFVTKIDRDSLNLFFAILAHGDPAKASRALGMKDSTLRSKIDGWRSKGKAYRPLIEFLRWRKSIKGRAGMEFAKRQASGGERDTDWGALMQDVLAELEEFNSDNWAEKCEQLSEILRSLVS